MKTPEHIKNWLDNLTDSQKAIRNYDTLGSMGKFAYMRKLNFPFRFSDCKYPQDADKRFFNFIAENGLKERFIKDFKGIEIQTP